MVFNIKVLRCNIVMVEMELTTDDHQDGYALAGERVGQLLEDYPGHEVEIEEVQD